MRSEADETRQPKYAHIERERRWLVDTARRPDVSGRPYILVKDRYVERTRIRLRRMTDSATGECSLKLTKKYDAEDPLARPIVTAYLSTEEYEVLALLPAKALAKRRYKIVEDAGEFSLDQFLGALEGLELAEIEWADDVGLRVLAAPAWTTREVSADPRYQGGTLAALGKPRD